MAGPYLIDPERASIDDVCRMLGISRSSVIQHTRSGMFPREDGQPKYNLFKIVPIWLQYRLDKRGAMASPTAAKGREVRERIRKLKLANDMVERMLLPAPEVMQAADILATMFRGQLEGLPGRMASELAGVSEPAIVKDKLRDECLRVLRHSSEGLRAIIDAAPDVHVEDDDDGDDDDEDDEDANGDGAGGGDGDGADA